MSEEMKEQLLHLIEIRLKADVMADRILTTEDCDLDFNMLDELVTKARVEISEKLKNTHFILTYVCENAN